MIPPRELFLPQDALTGDSAAFVASAPACVAACYRRLHADANVSAAMDDLRRRGMDAQAIEALYREVAINALEPWPQDVEPRTQTRSRRQRLAKQLRACAEAIAQDREAARMWIAVAGRGFGQTPTDLHALGLTLHAMKLSDLLQCIAGPYAASELAESTKAPRAPSPGRPMS